MTLPHQHHIIPRPSPHRATSRADCVPVNIEQSRLPGLWVYQVRRALEPGQASGSDAGGAGAGHG